MSSFTDTTLTRAEMKEIRGGWGPYSASCTCGNSGFSGYVPDLGAYKYLVNVYCNNGSQVKCTFS